VFREARAGVKAEAEVLPKARVEVPVEVFLAVEVEAEARVNLLQDQDPAVQILEVDLVPIKTKYLYFHVECYCKTH